MEYATAEVFVAPSKRLVVFFQFACRIDAPSHDDSSFEELLNNHVFYAVVPLPKYFCFLNVSAVFSNRYSTILGHDFNVGKFPVLFYNDLNFFNENGLKCIGNELVDFIGVLDYFDVLPY